MSVKTDILTKNHLKSLKLPTMLNEFESMARQCAEQGSDYVDYLTRLCELEINDREQRMIERRVKASRFPAVKSPDCFDFKATPSLRKMKVIELGRCEWIGRKENVVVQGPSGTGKTHIALGLGMSSCHCGYKTLFVTAAGPATELMEARDDRKLLTLQKRLLDCKLPIIDELGYVPFSKTGAELLFEVISRRYERGSVPVTSNLSFEEWTETFGSERLAGALLDRLTHNAHILEMNGDSFRPAHSLSRKEKVRDRDMNQTQEQ